METIPPSFAIPCDIRYALQLFNYDNTKRRWRRWWWWRHDHFIKILEKNKIQFFHRQFHNTEDERRRMSCPRSSSSKLSCILRASAATYLTFLQQFCTHAQFLSLSKANNIVSTPTSLIKTTIPIRGWSLPFLPHYYHPPPPPPL